MCKSMDRGGLGIRNREHNRVLLGKLLWRFEMEGDSSWRRIVVAKYGEVWS